MSKATPKPEIEWVEETPLRWPDGWPRKPIALRKDRGAWKKTMFDYRNGIIHELDVLGAKSAIVTCNAIGEDQRKDPGVAVWFSMIDHQTHDWQSGLKIDSPAPSLAEIDKAYRALAMPHHPDRKDASGNPAGDVEVFKRLTQYRDDARAWVLGTSKPSMEHCIACDTFEDVRLNLCGIKLALSHFRGLERVGVPAILERVMQQAFRAALTHTPPAPVDPVGAHA